MTALQLIGVGMVALPIVAFLIFCAVEGILGEVVANILGSLTIAGFMTLGVMLALGVIR